MTPAPPKKPVVSSPELPLNGGEAVLTMPCGKVRRGRGTDEGTVSGRWHLGPLWPSTTVPLKTEKKNKKKRKRA